MSVEPDCDVCAGFVTLQDAIDTPARVALCDECRELTLIENDEDEESKP